MFMLLNTSSSLLRASGYFFPVCYWGEPHLKCSPSLLDGRIETSAPGCLPLSVFNSQRWVECTSRSFNHFSSFLSSARGGGRGDKLDFSLIWNPERKAGADHSHSAGAYLKTKLVSRVHSAGVRLRPLNTLTKCEQSRNRGTQERVGFQFVYFHKESVLELYCIKPFGLHRLLFRIYKNHVQD